MTMRDEEMHDFEQVVRVPVEGGDFMTVRIEMVGKAVVGPGPRPKRDEVLMMRGVGDDQILIISVEQEQTFEAVVVGDGGRPTRRV